MLWLAISRLHCSDRCLLLRPTVTRHARALIRSPREHVQPDNSEHAHTDPAGPAKDDLPYPCHSQSTLRLTTISLEHSGAGCLCRRTAAVGSTISLTCSIAGARAERPVRVKLTSLDQSVAGTRTPRQTNRPIYIPNRDSGWTIE